MIKCAADADCVQVGANRCDGGLCVCGQTGGSCTAASGQPNCRKADDLTTDAEAPVDANDLPDWNAVCGVRKILYLWLYTFYLHSI